MRQTLALLEYYMPLRLGLPGRLNSLSELLAGGIQALPPRDV
jgi:hypothetical protein